MAQTPYLLGRLTAALEHLGAVDRRGHWLAAEKPEYLIVAIKKAMEQGEKAESLLLPLLAQLPAEPTPFGDTLTEVQQSDFELGYWHQRAEFNAGLLPTLSDDEPELTARYDMRIDPDLKEWVKAHGGDKLVRALLRAARERAGD